MSVLAITTVIPELAVPGSHDHAWNQRFEVSPLQGVGLALEKMRAASGSRDAGQLRIGITFSFPLADLALISIPALSSSLCAPKEPVPWAPANPQFAPDYQGHCCVLPRGVQTLVHSPSSAPGAASGPSEPLWFPSPAFIRTEHLRNA